MLWNVTHLCYFTVALLAIHVLCASFEMSRSVIFRTCIFSAPLSWPPDETGGAQRSTITRWALFISRSVSITHTYDAAFAASQGLTVAALFIRWLTPPGRGRRTCRGSDLVVKHKQQTMLIASEAEITSSTSLVSGKRRIITVVSDAVISHTRVSSSRPIKESYILALVYRTPCLDKFNIANRKLSKKYQQVTDHYAYVECQKHNALSYSLSKWWQTQINCAPVVVGISLKKRLPLIRGLLHRLSIIIIGNRRFR